MDDKMRETALKCAKGIAESLLERAKRDDKGLYWETMMLGADSNILWHAYDSLYSGNAGIAMFFAELARITGDERYREAAADNLKWVAAYWAENEPVSHAGFTGRMSCIFPYLLMAELTGEDWYLDQARECGKVCKDFEQPSHHRSDDLLNGTAGAILAYMHLHAALKEDWILERINTLITTELAWTHHGPKGLYWDRGPNVVKGLCGFSHGSAGVGFMFLELGYYFRNPTFYNLAEAAFDYESYWVEKYGFWPDLRRGMYDEKDRQEALEKYHAGDLNHFTEPRNMNVWCHGGPGLGYSRARAFELLKNQRYKDDLAVVEKVTRPLEDRFEDVPIDQQTLTLCHGRGGNRDFLWSARKHLDEAWVTKLCSSLADRALQHLEAGGFFLAGYPPSDSADTSLFMGDAGLGYFLLRLYDENTFSILAPSLSRQMEGSFDSTRFPEIAMTNEQAARRLLEKTHARTLRLLDERIPEKLKAQLDKQMEGSIPNVFDAFVNECLPELDEAVRERVADVLQLETTRYRVDQEIPSGAYLNIKRIDMAEQYKNFEVEGVETLPERNLKLNSDIVAMQTQWNWTTADCDVIANLTAEKEPTHVLIRPTPEDVFEDDLSPFANLILECFGEGAKVTDVIDQVTEAFDVNTDEERAQVKKLSLEQTHQAIQSGILEFV